MQSDELRLQAPKEPTTADAVQSAADDDATNAGADDGLPTVLARLSVSSCDYQPVSLWLLLHHLCLINSHQVIKATIVGPKHSKKGGVLFLHSLDATHVV